MGAPEKPTTSTTNSMQRVKVYRLNGEGKWDDQGTGHVTIDYLDIRHNSRSEDLGLFVVDEEDNETLLVHRISSEDIYRKQEDTIISWRDPEFSSELALSFQETTGCSYIWDHICNVQRNIQFNTINNEAYHGANSELRELPEVELSTLPSILKVVVGSSITDQLCVTELILHDQKFLPKLMDLFSMCEDLENHDGLHLIYKIVRGIILLNSPQIFDKIFSDELIMDIVGCLEYDPDVPHIHHRNFLKEHVAYKEAIPIKDPLALSKIHQTYRVTYLKDVVLARVLDDATVASLNTIIHSNNGMVVSMLKDDNTFIKELFTRLKSPSVGPESKTNLVKALLVTDPTSENPGGCTPADLASKSGYEGLSAYLAEKALLAHFEAMTLAGNVSGSLQSTIPDDDNSFTNGTGSNITEEEQYLKDTLAAYRRTADAAARIQAAFREQSFKLKSKAVEFSNTEDEARCIIAAMRIQHAFRRHETKKQMTAAVHIQHRFRTWKIRKDFLNKRRQAIKIQAFFRGFQVRKQYKKLVWSVGVLEKAIIRWRLRRKGFRGLQVAPSKADEEDEKQDNISEESFFQASRKQAEERVERSVVRVQAMFRSKKAQEEYRKMKLEHNQASLEYDELLNPATHMER